MDLPPKKKWWLPKGFPITAVHWRLPSRDHSAPPPKWRAGLKWPPDVFPEETVDWVVVEPAHINLYIYRYLCTTVYIRIFSIYIVYYIMSLYIYIHIIIYILYYIVLYYIILYYFTLFYIILYYIILYCVYIYILYYIMYTYIIIYNRYIYIYTQYIYNIYIYIISYTMYTYIYIYIIVCIYRIYGVYIYIHPSNGHLAEKCGLLKNAT